MQNILWIILIFFIGVICGATFLWLVICKKKIEINGVGGNDKYYNDTLEQIHKYTQSPIIR
jgi:hypothetical protein